MIKINNTASSVARFNRYATKRNHLIELNNKTMEITAKLKVANKKEAVDLYKALVDNTMAAHNAASVIAESKEIPMSWIKDADHGVFGSMEFAYKMSKIVLGTVLNDEEVARRAN